MNIRRFALLTAICTWLLLIAGGLVHGTGSSLACPDWPLCHGQFFPEMSHGVEYEHGHRLTAGTVSILTLILSIAILRSDRYRALRGLAIAAPIMVLAQATLGGLTVIFKLPTAITLSHLTLSMCFFSVVVMIAARTRFEGGVVATARATTGWTLRSTVGAIGVLILGQILLGGLVRHRMAGLACTTFPLCFGHIWPPDSTSVFSERIHMLHRFGAVIVGTAVIWASIVVRRRAVDVPSLRLAATIAPVLVLLQVTLGVLSVTSLLQLHTVTAHLACGALVLASVVTMWTLLPLAAPATERSKTMPAPRASEAVSA